MANKETQRVYDRTYYANNKEKIKRQQAEYSDNNREKISRRRAEWRAANKEKIKSYHLRRFYGLTLQAFDDMLDAQHGECALCFVKMELGGYSKDSVCVDHDHETGDVRALLCKACNTALGGFDDNPTVLRRAADYLDAHEGN